MKTETKMSDKNKKNISEIIEPSFQSLISSIYSAILYNLGEIKIKGIDKHEENKEMAQFNIGLLEMLEKKTCGNLTGEEEHLLKNLVATAKLNYARHLEEPKES